MLFNAFSNPFEGNFYAVAEVLASKCALKVLDRVNELALAYEETPILLRENLLSFTGEKLELWRPELGTIWMALNSFKIEKSDWSWLSGQLQIAFFLTGVVSKLDLVIKGRHPLTICGRQFSSETLRVSASDKEIAVTNLCDSEVTVFSRFSIGGFDYIWAASKDEIVQVGNSAPILLSDGDWINIWCPSTPRGALYIERERFKKDFCQCMQVLEDGFPEYFLWINLMIREIVPLYKPKIGGTNGRSFGLWPRHIHVGFPESTCAILDALVHEASHHYFHLTQWLFPTVTPDAPEVYSVIKKTDRPLAKLFLGYHAIGNELLFLKMLRDSGLEYNTESFENNWGHAQDLVVGLNKTLGEYESKYLTNVGMDIYFPLKNRLREIGVIH